MKVGDTVVVNIGSHAVANAKITEIVDGKATIVIPATKVVAAIKTELDLASGPDGTGNSHVVLGLDDATQQVQEINQQMAQPVAPPTVTTTDTQGNEVVLEGTPVVEESKTVTEAKEAEGGE